MWIERVRAVAFGPLLAQELEFGPGMNVVVGPNESGKSAWHATLFAALCGMRRARGAPRVEDREFATRHRPWNGEGWRASAIVHLADGRRIEIAQDLATMVDCRATDLTLGRDVSAEIMGDGSPDGARWLGLDRTSFLATACVRQADILEVQQSADALQDTLQRAATSARAESTAAAAIARLEEFERDEIGTERAPTRPLRQAAARVDAAKRDLQVTKEDHVEFLILSREVDEARSRAEATAIGVRAAGAAQAQLKSEGLSQRLAEARRLDDLFPNGEPPGGLSDDDDAKRVATVLDRWRRRPVLPELQGETSSDIRSRIADLDAQTEGDNEVHQSVSHAASAWREVDAVLRQHELERPQPIPAPDAGGFTVADLYVAAAGLSGHGPVHGARGVSPFWYIVAALLAAAGVGCLVAGLVVPAVALFAVSGTLLALRLLRPGPAPARESIEGGADSVRAELTLRGLPTTAVALRSLAQAVAEFEQRQTMIATWNERRESLVLRRGTADTAVRSALRERGVAVREEESTEDLYRAYEVACRVQLERANTLQTLRAELQRRELEEGHYTAVAKELDEITEQAREVASPLGLGSSEPHVIQALIPKLEDWQHRREDSLQELDSLRRQWARLEALLDGGALQDLEATAHDAYAEAERQRASADAADIETALAWMRGEDGPKRLDDLTAAERDRREALVALTERLRQRTAVLRDPAVAMEELAVAEGELARIRQLADVVRRTRQFLESAVDRAHRTIAPMLQAALSDRLSLVTRGRYVEALVDPETLDVRVRERGGAWRSASALSHGTSEQVYLLLRVALAEHLVRAGESTPFIFDDATVHSDEARTEAILDTLLALTPNHQVIVFSQEAEVAAWARARLGGELHRIIALPELSLAN